MTRYLVDNSVLQRLPRSTEVRAALSAIVDAEDDLCSCAASVDEFGYSARTPSEYAEAARRLRSSFLYLSMVAEIDDTIHEIRAAMFAAGQGRAAGIVDVQIAATAVQHDAIVLHYDSDFDHIAQAYPAFSAQWIVPRGTVD